MKRHERKRSTIKEEIIGYLLIEEEDGLRYSDIKKKLSVSDTTLAKNLKELLREDRINLCRLGDRKYHYIVNRNPKKITQDDLIKYFSYDYESYITESIFDTPLPKTNFDEYVNKINEFDSKKFIELIIKKISPYFVFLILKSFESGDNWLKIFNSDEMKREILIMFFPLLNKNNTADNMKDFYTILLQREFDLFFKFYNSEINKKSKPDFNKLYKNLKELYPEETKKIFDLIK